MRPTRTRTGWLVRFRRRGEPTERGTLLVIPRLCASCGQHSVAKPVTVYWAWRRADNSRVAWRQKLCYACFAQEAAPLIVAAEQPVFACSSCGIDTTDDHDDIYLTYYVPGMEKAQSELPTCPSCAVRIRNGAMVGAVQLEDREHESRGAFEGPPTTSPADIWRALGIEPGPRREART